MRKNTPKVIVYELSPPNPPPQYGKFPEICNFFVKKTPFIIMYERLKFKRRWVRQSEPNISLKELVIPELLAKKHDSDLPWKC